MYINSYVNELPYLVVFNERSVNNKRALVYIENDSSQI